MDFCNVVFWFVIGCVVLFFVCHLGVVVMFMYMLRALSLRLGTLKQNKKNIIINYYKWINPKQGSTTLSTGNSVLVSKYLFLNSYFLEQ